MAMLGQSKAAAAKRFRIEQAAMGNMERPMLPPAEIVSPSQTGRGRFGGVFGALGRAGGVIGRTMNTGTDNPGPLQTLLFGTDWADSRINNRRQAQEDAYTMEERKRADEERQRLEAFISRLPADQQMLARMNPEAFAKAMMASGAQQQEPTLGGGGFMWINPQTGRWEEIPGAAAAYRRAHPQAAGGMGLPPLPPGFQIETGN